jgi:hypothetical protein
MLLRRVILIIVGMVDTVERFEPRGVTDGPMPSFAATLVADSCLVGEKQCHSNAHRCCTARRTATIQQPLKGSRLGFQGGVLQR